MTRFRLVLVTLAAAVAVAVIISVLDWRSRPDTFGFGNAFSTRLTPGEQLQVAMVESSIDEEQRTITLHDAKARVVENSADAEITFSLCRMGATPIGAVKGPLDKWCRQVLPIDDTEMTLDEDSGEIVVMTIRPTEPGTVRVRGMDLRYTDGWKSGFEHVGMVVRVRVD